MKHQKLMVSIKPTACVIYKERNNYGYRNSLLSLSSNNLKHNKHNGYLSAASQKNLRAKINLYLLACGWATNSNLLHSSKPANSINIVTLTLSSKQIHDDKIITRDLLNNFLQKLRNNHKIINYIWKAEKQKNGNIHYHILINKYIYWSTIRKYWNECQETKGYITRFKAKYGHTNPNSTDIHSCRGVKSVAAYICKYMSKDARYTMKGDVKVYTEKGIDGRIWACSSSLSVSIDTRYVLADDTVDTLNDLMMDKSYTFKRYDYCDIIFGNMAKAMVACDGGIFNDAYIRFKQGLATAIWGFRNG